jgi:hypothetical protein
MLNFDQKKFQEKWEVTYKPRIYLLICFVLVFVFGYGVGNLRKETAKISAKRQTAQTTQNKTNPKEPAEAVKAVTASSTSPDEANCIVKGNINSAGKKIYHVSSGAFYKTVKPEQCFKTEAEAAQAGFVKSSR